MVRTPAARWRQRGAGSRPVVHRPRRLRAQRDLGRLQARPAQSRRVHNREAHQPEKHVAVFRRGPARGRLGLRRRPHRRARGESQGFLAVLSIGARSAPRQPARGGTNRVALVARRPGDGPAPLRPRRARAARLLRGRAAGAEHRPRCRPHQRADPVPDGRAARARDHGRAGASGREACAARRRAGLPSLDRRVWRVEPGRPLDVVQENGRGRPRCRAGVL